MKSTKLKELLSQKSWTGASNRFATDSRTVYPRRTYYARLNVENPVTGFKKNQRVPLITKAGKLVQTVAQAVTELKRLRTQRSDNTLPTRRERQSLTITRRAT